jgi:hypothetical protein
LMPDYGDGSAASTSTAGLVGGGITLVVAGLVGLALKKRRSSRAAS